MMGWMLMLLGLMQGDREQGLQLYREGRYAEAAAAFQRAVQSEGDSPELQWNLALAHWRAGEIAAAETAAEKYAATSTAVQVDLHSCLLGAIRHQEALLKVAEADQAQAAAGQPPAAAAGAAPGAPAADPLPLLQAALAKANQARDHFVRGAKVEATPELRRNTERTLRLIDELKRRIEELEQQRQPSEDKDQQDGKKEDKPDEPKQDEQSKEEQDQKQPEPKPDEQKADQKEQDQKGKEQDQKAPKDQKQDQPKPQDGKPDQAQQGEDGKPSSDGEPKPEPQPGDKPGEPSEPKPEPGQPGEEGQAEAAKDQKPGQEPSPRQDATGEQLDARELSPEQTQRLLERLQGLDGKQKSIRARAKSSRRTVERDW